jgi:hypothetical protein
MGVVIVIFSVTLENAEFATRDARQNMAMNASNTRGVGPTTTHRDVMYDFGAQQQADVELRDEGVVHASSWRASS